MAETYFIIHNRLDADVRYASLSVHAKYLYGKLRDLLKLSIQNNWQDENGFYVRMTRETMTKLLKICLPTARKVVRELVGVCLLKERREGLNKSNRLYVQLFPGEDELAFQCKVKQSSPSKRKPDFTPEGNAVSPNQRNLNHSEVQPEQNKNNEAKRPTPEDVKRDHFWVLKEGNIFRYKGSFWIYEDGEVTPYRFGEDLKKDVIDLLASLGMSPDDIPLAMAGVGM